MEEKAQIKTVIEAFVKAGEERNINSYDSILHPNFRVVANHYPSPDKTTFLNKETYIDLIKKKVIGGTKFNLIFKDISLVEHSATVQIQLAASKGGQIITFLLIKNAQQQWQIVSDMAVQTS